MDDNIKVALILEDDVNFNNSSIIENLNAILSKEQLLHSNTPIAIQLEESGTRCDKRNVISLNRNTKLYKSYGSFCTASYLINLAGAKSLLLNLHPVRFVADEWGTFVKFGWINLYRIYPALFFQNCQEIKSTIDDRVIIYKERKLSTKKT